MSKDSLGMEGDEAPDSQHFPLIAVWLAAMLVLAAVVFREISVFLLRIEGSSHSYGPNVFTGFQVKFWDTDALMAAAGPGGVWDTNDLAKPFVSWHLTLDLVFPLLLGWALLRCLVAVAEEQPRDRRTVPESKSVVLLPLAYVVFDLAETGYTFDAMQCRLRGLGCEFEITTRQALVIHLLSDLKWVALVVTLLAIAGFYLWSPRGAISWQRRREFHRRLHKRKRLVAGPPAGTVVVVCLLFIVLALPGGSALDQIPDVIRAQIDQVQHHEWQHAAYSLGSLLLFLMTLLVIVHPPWQPVAPYPTYKEREEPEGETKYDRWVRMRDRHALCRRDVAVVCCGIALSAGLVVMHRSLEGAWDLPLGLAPAIVVLAIFFVAFLTSDFRSHLHRRQKDEDPQDGQDARKEQSEPQADLEVTDAMLEDAEQVTGGYARLRAALLPGVLVLGVGLALVRATLPAFMAPDVSQEAEFRALLIGLGLAAVLSVLVAWGLDVLYRGVRLRRWLRCALGVVLGLVNLVIAVVLATRPERAGRLGAVAVVVVALSAWLCIVAGFALLSRHVLWQRTVDLRLGHRTPWLTISMVVWGWPASSTRPAATTTPGPSWCRMPRQPTRPGSARWTGRSGRGLPSSASRRPRCATTSSWTPRAGAATEPNDSRKVPLVLVASPGGGGKAAYWTALGLDRTFSSGGFCPQSLFVASASLAGRSASRPPWRSRPRPTRWRTRARTMRGPAQWKTTRTTTPRPATATRSPPRMPRTPSVE